VPRVGPRLLFGVDREKAGRDSSRDSLAICDVNKDLILYRARERREHVAATQNATLWANKAVVLPTPSPHQPTN